MIDREKVIKGLEVCMDVDGNCYECPYTANGEGPEQCDRQAMKDALALLREQEPDLPGTWLLDRPNHYKCSVCGAQWGQAARMMRHCPDCGRRMEI